ncbi:hypothetical protein KNT87_gp238 [Erwinia phage Cronus]|uniref:Uncharacterized protein n=1 Tax=Erwinia phage Cronus TaxID=2163633 RepID=A0A2S1GLR2_9CAUD|nr:hypothetical protein KNT87_gp238 [Erwinia phage Cronus]AWD90331.1 hypothetical protein [Erwinia phage Cronus]
MTYLSRDKTHFVFAFTHMMNSKFTSASLGLNKWRSLSDFSGILAVSAGLDREFFYKSGSLIMRPIIKDILGGYTLEDYDLQIREVLVITVGMKVQFEVRKTHRNTFEYRVIKA